jgi:hypothetical protein
MCSICDGRLTTGKRTTSLGLAWLWVSKLEHGYKLGRHWGYDHCLHPYASLREVQFYWLDLPSEDGFYLISSKPIFICYQRLLQFLLIWGLSVRHPGRLKTACQLVLSPKGAAPITFLLRNLVLVATSGPGLDINIFRFPRENEIYWKKKECFIHKFVLEIFKAKYQ